jgi:hypothetical protein
MEGKRPLRRSRSTSMWEDNIKIDLREVGWGGMDRIHLAKDRNQWSDLVNREVKLRAP